MTQNDEPRDRHVDDFERRVSTIEEFQNSRPDLQTNVGLPETREQMLLNALKAQVNVNTMMSQAIADLEQRLQDLSDVEKEGNYYQCLT